MTDIYGGGPQTSHSCDHLCACAECFARVRQEQDIALGISLTIMEWYKRVKDKLFSDGYRPGFVTQAEVIIERETR